MVLTMTVAVLIVVVVAYFLEDRHLGNTPSSRSAVGGTGHSEAPGPSASSGGLGDAFADAVSRLDFQGQLLQDALNRDGLQASIDKPKGMRCSIFAVHSGTV